MKNFSVHKALTTLQIHLNYEKLFSKMTLPTFITDITNITLKNFSFYTLKTYSLIMKNFS